MSLKLTVFLLLAASLCNAGVFDQLFKSERDKHLEVNKRQTPSICAQLAYNCLDPGATCYSGDANIPACSACTTAYDTCAETAGQNVTAQCICTQTVFDCLVATNEPACVYLFRDIAQDVADLCQSEECTCPVPEETGIPLCNLDMFCNPQTSECEARGSVDDTCQNLAWLFSGGSSCGFEGGVFSNNLRCVDGTCEVPTPNAAANDGCTEPSECFSNMQCIAGVCVGFGVDEECDGDFDGNDCAFGLYCNSETSPSVCTPVVPLGESCTSTESCGLNSCIEGTCMPTYSQGLGEACEETEHCQFGYWCENGACAVPQSLPPPLCTTDDDCTAFPGSRCLCDQFLGENRCFATTNPLPECSPFIENALNCMVDNECSRLSESPNSCFMRNCEEHLGCALYCVGQTLPSAVLDCYSSSPTEGLCPALQSTAPSTPTDPDVEPSSASGVCVSFTAVASLLTMAAL